MEEETIEDAPGSWDRCDYVGLQPEHRDIFIGGGAGGGIAPLEF